MYIIIYMLSTLMLFIMGGVTGWFATYLYFKTKQEEKEEYRKVIIVDGERYYQDIKGVSYESMDACKWIDKN